MKNTIELTIGLQRLEKLADHLEHGKLGHTEFDFSGFNLNAEPYQCGTAGCAIGECPILFPNDWYFASDRMPKLKEGSIDSPTECAAVFFGIQRFPEAYHLFMPESQDPELFGGKVLRDNATRHEVAANIRAFIQKKIAE